MSVLDLESKKRENTHTMEEKDPQTKAPIVHDPEEGLPDTADTQAVVQGLQKALSDLYITDNSPIDQAGEL